GSCVTSYSSIRRRCRVGSISCGVVCRGGRRPSGAASVSGAGGVGVMVDSTTTSRSDGFAGAGAAAAPAYDPGLYQDFCCTLTQIRVLASATFDQISVVAAANQNSLMKGSL